MVIMIGAFPPPIHGMANVNKAMYLLLASESEDVVAIDISAATLQRSMLARFERIYRVLTGMLLLLRKGKHHKTTLYMSVSGGSGQFYEILYILVSKIFYAKLVLHHHSFAYLNDVPSLLMKLLTWVAGRSASHVCLSAEMATRLALLYPSVSATFALSNVVFLNRNVPAKSLKKNLATIGYLSNISSEKGVFHFLELCKALHQAGISISCILAGPFQDADSEIAVKDILAVLPNTTYIGPVYGSKKDAFFDSIDALVFPTVYANEAEPLTILEALSWSVPVIAYGRGAIPEILKPPFGLAVGVADPFTEAALAQLRYWQMSSVEYQRASLAAGNSFKALEIKNQANLDWLVTDITRQNH
jgi:glycosyltransferase involved in cell wall biosynthesis